MKPRSKLYAKIAQNLTAFGFAAVVGCILAYGAVLGRFGFRLSPNSADWGSFGDFVSGLAGTLIGLATLFALALTLHLQSRELEETRQELNKQAASAERQTFEGTFFRLLQTLRNLVDKLQIAQGPTGVSAMHHWAITLRDVEGGALKHRDMNPIDMTLIYLRWYAGYRYLLAPYFELITRTIEYIDRSDRPDKVFYSEVLRATLSPGELFLLFHYGAATREKTSFKALAENYGLLEAFDPEMYDLQGDRRLWYRARSVTLA